jgi:hypothetical protein
MELSARAQKLVSEGETFERPTNREEVTRFFESTTIPPNPVFLDFQEKYAGRRVFAASMQERVELSILMDPGDGQYQIAGVDDEGEWIIAVGRFEHSSHLLMMDEDGIIYADSIPIADSFEKWLESHAVANEMLAEQDEWYGTAFMAVHRDDRKFDSIVDLPQIEEASDSYTKWWGEADMKIERAVFWDPANQTHVVRGFAKDAADLPKLLSYFEKAHSASPPVIWWPYRIEDGQPVAPDLEA